MTLEEAARCVQFAYPRIYLACHSHHQNARTTTHGLSARDATILAHLSEELPLPQSELARHLGVAKSTLSEAVTWLSECGYLVKAAGEGGREQLLRLTPEGAQAMSQSSVLETGRLAHVLACLSAEERAAAVHGLELLAQAALRSPHQREETCA